MFSSSEGGKMTLAYACGRIDQDPIFGLANKVNVSLFPSSKLLPL